MSTEILSKITDVIILITIALVAWVVVEKIIGIWKGEKSKEYKQGYNQCLKDQKLTGERWEHLYL